MSRIGKKPVVIPKGVEVRFDPPELSVKGPKGNLSARIPEGIGLEIADGEIRVTRPDDGRRSRSLHGTTRSVVQNLVTGVTEGFRKELEIKGVGYRANLQGSTLVMNLGFSHPVEYPVPKDVTIEVKDQRIVSVSGIDRQRVGQVAAEIRAVKPPEPYKGTGIQYVGEHIVRKEGKSGAR
ncbi:50S ribosomal protein L6 [Deferrisoma camini]|uniref:50S ribosomal protein L6 n=1 Tax=Deferrisoma camini TaxID=1035120 RepID=UPI00046D2E6C|nr:50S ribosomal protein L6 [Deferrisoma camini]